jgi:hypothetical protein
MKIKYVRFFSFFSIFVLAFAVINHLSVFMYTLTVINTLGLYLFAFQFGERTGKGQALKIKDLDKNALYEVMSTHYEQGFICFRRFSEQGNCAFGPYLYLEYHKGDLAQHDKFMLIKPIFVKIKNGTDGGFKTLDVACGDIKIIYVR